MNKKGPIHDSVVLQVPGYALRQLFEATKRPSRAWWKGRCTCSILFHLHGIRIREKKRTKWSFWPFLDSKFVTKYWRTCSHQVDLWICWEGALVLRSLEIFSIFQPLAGLHLRLFQRRLFESEAQCWRCVESAHVARTDCWIWAVTNMFLWCCKFNNSQFGECREGLWTSNLMKLRKAKYAENPVATSWPRTWPRTGQPDLARWSSRKVSRSWTATAFPSLSTTSGSRCRSGRSWLLGHLGVEPIQPNDFYVVRRIC